MFDVDPDVVVVGPSVRNRLDHACDRLPDLLGVRAPGQVNETGYPAHPAASPS